MINITMNSPPDTFGNGTHVASIAAGSFKHGISHFGYGSGTARGVAPKAHVTVYKSLWEEDCFYLNDIL